MQCNVMDKEEKQKPKKNKVTKKKTIKLEENHRSGGKPFSIVTKSVYAHRTSKSLSLTLKCICAESTVVAY